MDPIAKSEVFFFVTTLCVVLITVVVAVLIVYAIRIARDIRFIISRTKDEAEDIADDLKMLRENLKTKGKGLLSLLSLIFLKHKAKKKAKKE